MRVEGEGEGEGEGEREGEGEGEREGLYVHLIPQLFDMVLWWRARA